MDARKEVMVRLPARAQAPAPPDGRDRSAAALWPAQVLPAPRLLPSGGTTARPAVLGYKGKGLVAAAAACADSGEDSISPTAAQAPAARFLRGRAAPACPAEPEARTAHTATRDSPPPLSPHPPPLFPYPTPLPSHPPPPPKPRRTRTRPVPARPPVAPLARRTLAASLAARRQRCVAGGGLPPTTTTTSSSFSPRPHAPDPAERRGHLRPGMRLHDVTTTVTRMPSGARTHPSRNSPAGVDGRMRARALLCVRERSAKEQDCVC